MVKKGQKRLKVVDVEGSVRKQAESAKENYQGWIAFNKSLMEESLKAIDMQLELMLSMQLGFLDFLQNTLEIKPMIKPFEHRLSPYAEHIGNVGEFNRELLEINKRKVEKLTRDLQRYHRKAVESTISAFDTYCDLLSTA
ncbi:MAG: hypothetical protein RIG61_07200 [Deltaproteobacteria bacterium]